MKKIMDFVLGNKLAVWLLTFMVVFAGIYSTTKIKMESMPDVSIPYLVVMTPYPGASSDQVAIDVGDKLEQQINNLEGVKTTLSNSYANASVLQVEFEYGTDMEKKEQEIQKIADKLELPDGVGETNVMAITMNAMPISVLSVYDEEKNNAELTKFIEENLLDDLRKIEGVADVSIEGATKEKYKLNFDEAKLAGLGLSKETVLGVIQGNTTTMPLGIFDFTESKENVVVSGNFESIEQLKSMVIPAYTPVTLGEFATFELVNETTTTSRVNGKDAISLVVTKTQEGNTVAVGNAVLEKMAEFEDKFKTISYDIILDQAEPIKASVFTMVEKAIFGAIFAVVVILLFLRNFRSTVISIVSIPMSILMTLILLHQLDITLNIMTLGAMTVAIGRVIDDSIVVIENIFRRLSDGKEQLRGKELIKSATIEMFLPILSSTLVTVAVFLPLALVGGMIGELFMPFALTMVFALLSSLLVAITIVPVMAHRLFRKELKGQDVLKNHEERGKLAKFYGTLLEKVLNHKLVTILATLALLGISIASLGKVGFTFMGSQESYQVQLNYEAKIGEVSDSIEENVKTMEEYLLGLKEVDTIQATVGVSDIELMFGMAKDASITITLDEDEEIEDVKVVKEKIERFILEQKVLGEWTMSDASEAMMGSGNVMSFGVYSDNEEDLKDLSAKLVDELSKVKGFEDVSSSLAKYYVENKWVVDEESAAKHGLTTAQIGMQLMNYELENAVTTVKVDNKEIDVVTVTEKVDYEKPEDLGEKLIYSPMGTAVKLKYLATLELGETPASITKQSEKMFVTVSGTIDADDVTKIAKEVQEVVDDIKLPSGVSIDTGGVTEDMAESFTQLGLAILAAIAIVYFILVVTFKEGLAPFAILFSLPLTVIGVVFGNLIANEPLSVTSMLGLLMLVGIVVTNAIVLIDKILHFEVNGLERREAIIEAAEIRLRPILMTAIATIFALIPLLFQTSTDSLISKGLAVTVIGGLFSSTILTLFIVPLVYEWLSKVFKKDRTKIEE